MRRPWSGSAPSRWYRRTRRNLCPEPWRQFVRCGQKLRLTDALPQSIGALYRLIVFCVANVRLGSIRVNVSTAIALGEAEMASLGLLGERVRRTRSRPDPAAGRGCRNPRNTPSRRGERPPSTRVADRRADAGSVTGSAAVTVGHHLCCPIGLATPAHCGVTSVIYTGDRTTIPPQGGTTQSALIDALAALPNWTNTPAPRP